MTIININLKTPYGDSAANWTVHFTPVKRLLDDEIPDILPQPVTVQLDANGVGSTELPASGVDWAYCASEQDPKTGQVNVRNVIVPDAASADYTALQEPGWRTKPNYAFIPSVKGFKGASMRVHEGVPTGVPIETSEDSVVDSTTGDLYVVSDTTTNNK